MTRLVSFGFKMWMSRELGAETVGLYQIALSIILLLFSLTAGAPTVLSRKVAGAMGDRRKQNGYLTGTLLLGLGVGVVLIVVFFCCHNHLDALFADDRCVTLFLIMLPTLLTSTLYGALRSWFWGQKKFLAFSSTELLEEVIKIVVAVILAGGVISTINRRDKRAYRRSDGVVQDPPFYYGSAKRRGKASALLPLRQGRIRRALLGAYRRITQKCVSPEAQGHGACLRRACAAQAYQA